MDKAREWLYFGTYFAGSVEALLTPGQLAIIRRIEEMEYDLRPIEGVIPQSVLMTAHFIHLNEMKKTGNPYHAISINKSSSERASR